MASVKTLPTPSFFQQLFQRACAYWIGAAAFAVLLSLFVLMAGAVASTF